MIDRDERARSDGWVHTHERAQSCSLAGANGAEATGRPTRSPSISVVIPTLNEALNLPLVFAHLPDDIDEIVVVDGFSTDDTVEAAKRLREDVTIVQQSRRGKGNALAHGFDVATGDIIVMLDADGSTDPREIPLLVHALVSGSDYAKGSRFLEGGGSSDITMLRRLGNVVLRTLVNILFGTRYSDLCYGYNAFWRRCLSSIHVDCDGFEVETLMNIQAAQSGLKIVEVPSFERDRVHGESNLRPVRDGWRVLKTILRQRFAPPLRSDADVLSTSSVELIDVA